MSNSTKQRTINGVTAPVRPAWAGMARMPCATLSAAREEGDATTTRAAGPLWRRNWGKGGAGCRSQLTGSVKKWDRNLKTIKRIIYEKSQKNPKQYGIYWKETNCLTTKICSITTPPPPTTTTTFLKKEPFVEEEVGKMRGLESLPFLQLTPALSKTLNWGERGAGCGRSELTVSVMNGDQKLRNGTAELM